MKTDQRILGALRSAEPARALRALVAELSREGRTRQGIHELLEKFVVNLRTRTDFRAIDEDLILDVLDALTGWCHPNAELSVEEKPASQV